MSNTWDSLTVEQRNEKVATKVMRLELTDERSFDYSDIKEPSNAAEDMSGFQLWSNGVCVKAYRPTKNIAQAWEVQERIVSLGLESAWAAYLEGLLSTAEFIAGNRTWCYAWATPDQRCHAAVLAVEGMKNEKDEEA